MIKSHPISFLRSRDRVRSISDWEREEACPLFSYPQVYGFCTKAVPVNLPLVVSYCLPSTVFHCGFSATVAYTELICIYSLSIGIHRIILRAIPHFLQGGTITEGNRVSTFLKEFLYLLHSLFPTTQKRQELIAMYSPMGTGIQSFQESYVGFQDTGNKRD